MLHRFLQCCSPPCGVSCNVYSIGERYTKIQTYLNTTHNEKQQTVHKENSVSSPSVVDCSVAGMRAWGMGTSFLAAYSAGPRRHSPTTAEETELLQKRYQQQSSMTVFSDPTQMAILRKKFTDAAKIYIGVPSYMQVRERKRGGEERGSYSCMDAACLFIY